MKFNISHKIFSEDELFTIFIQKIHSGKTLDKKKIFIIKQGSWKKIENCKSKKN
jgi:hypothetical protein